MKNIVNPSSLENCWLKCGDLSLVVLDISFVRVVVELCADFERLLGQRNPVVKFELDGLCFEASVSLQKKSADNMRLSIENLAPSSKSMLRSFLSPKRIGESIIEDWQSEGIRHFHGLNESELWVYGEGMTFLYLDHDHFDRLFMVRLGSDGGAMQVGSMSRSEYLDKMDMTSELPLLSVDAKDIFSHLGECRDIVTNFRHSGQQDFKIKQRLLEVVSDYLYTTRTGSPLGTLAKSSNRGFIESESR